MKQRFIVACLCLILLLGLQGLADAGPKEDIQGSVDTILEILRNKTLSKEESRKKISEVIHARFNFESMAQRTLATNWKSATAEQRKRFTDLFAEILEQTYMGRVEAYTDEKVEFGDVKTKGNSALVETSIVTSSVNIPIHYKLTQEGPEWKVYDVVIEEVSLVRNYRDTYREIVKKEGFDGLFAKMEEKISEMKSVKEQG